MQCHIIFPYKFFIETHWALERHAYIFVCFFVNMKFHTSSVLPLKHKQTCGLTLGCWNWGWDQRATSHILGMLRGSIHNAPPDKICSYARWKDATAWHYCVARKYRMVRGQVHSTFRICSHSLISWSWLRDNSFLAQMFVNIVFGVSHWIDFPWNGDSNLFWHRVRLLYRDDLVLHWFFFLHDFLGKTFFTFHWLLCIDSLVFTLVDLIHDILHGFVLFDAFAFLYV